jgi:hypothetical protein
MKLGAVNECIRLDRPGMCGALAQRLEVGLAGSSDVLLGDRRERDELYGVDLDRAETDRVARPV